MVTAGSWRSAKESLRKVPSQGEWSEDPLVIRVVPKEITRSGRAVSKSHKIGHILALDPPVGGTLCSSDEGSRYPLWAIRVTAARRSPAQPVTGIPSSADEGQNERAPDRSGELFSQVSTGMRNGIDRPRIGVRFFGPADRRDRLAPIKLISTLVQNAFCAVHVHPGQGTSGRCRPRIGAAVRGQAEDVRAKARRRRGSTTPDRESPS